MTAVNWLYEQLQERVIAQDVIARKMIIEISMEDYIKLKKEALQMEKQDIISGYAFGHNDGCRYMTNVKQEFEHGEGYFAETYGSKGSNNLPKVQNKDSFGEISDEEIEEQSWGYREVTKDMEIPPNEDWSNGAKWYREQLKLK